MNIPGLQSILKTLELAIQDRDDASIDVLESSLREIYTGLSIPDRIHLLKTLPIDVQTILNRPVFIHNCNICIFLGSSSDFSSDIYVCPNSIFDSVILRRFSSNPPDFESIPINFITSLPIEWLQEASILAFSYISSNYKKSL